MDIQFVITLSEHRKLGYLFAPYVIKNETIKGNYAIYDRVTLLNLKSYEDILTPEENQLVNFIEEYNDTNLMKFFSKKKGLPSREFIAGITTELLENQIRPYIEKRMAKCVEILIFNPVPVYHKVLQNNIYESDRIRVAGIQASAVFNFIRSDQGIRYFLSIDHNGRELRLKDKNGIIAVNEPCCVIIENDMYQISDVDGKKLNPFFKKEYIAIPPSAEKKFLETFARNAIKKYKVNASGFQILDLNLTPARELNIECGLNGRYYYVLKFNYGGKNIYYANRKTELKVTLEYEAENIRFTRIQRDYNFENESIATLLSFGLVNREGPYFMPLSKTADEKQSAYQTINWINENKKILEESGYNVSQDKLEKEYFLDTFFIKINISEKTNDWFDIEANVEFPGFVVPFSAFRDNILNGEREYMLPDGRIVILPTEWFVNYRDMLVFSRVEKEQIRLEKQHFPILNKFSKQLKGSDLFNLLQKSNEKEDVPPNINARLRSYQIDGYSWLYKLSKNGFGGCLADDMGLGKTLQTLTLLQRIYLENYGNKELQAKNPLQLSLFENKALASTASLIVVPTSLVHNWWNEAMRFTPALTVSLYVGPGRKNLSELAAESNIIITSYGILRNDLPKFLELKFRYLVLDESQMIKNPGSKTYQSVIQINAENRLVLTGTPIENSLLDLWSQMNFLNPGLLGSLAFFQAEFQYPVEKDQDENKKLKLMKLISPFVLRRSKMEVEPQLPAVSEQIIFCDMNEKQETYYELEKSRVRNLIIEKLSELGFNKSTVYILQSLTKLRQIANHPAMVDEEYFSGSGKYDEVIRNMHNLYHEGHKTLVFSSFVKHLSLISNYLDNENIKYAWLTGETKDRETEIRKFQEGSEYRFFLISLKAGGTGLNLTAADYVIILDPWWNPAAELQAISRAHRIGQDKHVIVYRFISRNTLEEKILKLQDYKSQLADAFINNSLKGITAEEVMDLFD